MADISKIKVPVGSSTQTYDIKDTKAISALVDIIDSGPKNLIDAQKPSGQQRVTITNGSDGAINISCNSAAWATTAYTFNIKPNVDYTVSIYVENPNLSGVNRMVFVNDYNNNELHRHTITNSLSQVFFVINSQYSENKFSFNINNSATAGSGSATVKLMICPTALWDVSVNYVPYRPSYDELVARITALENT